MLTPGSIRRYFAVKAKAELLTLPLADEQSGGSGDQDTGQLARAGSHDVAPFADPVLANQQQQQQGQGMSKKGLGNNRQQSKQRFPWSEINVAYILPYGNTLPEYSHTTPLFFAAAKGNLGKVNEILQQPQGENDIDLNHLTEGFSALYIACHSGHVDIVRALAGDPRIQVNLGDSQGVTPLFVASGLGRQEVVHALMEVASDRLDLNLGGYQRQGLTALHIACYEGHDHVVHLLLEYGANINPRTADRITPLFLACVQGHVKCVKRLLGFGPEVEVRQSWRAWTPIEVAKNGGFQEIVALLQDYLRNPLRVRSEIRAELGFMIASEPLNLVIESDESKHNIQLHAPFSFRELRLFIKEHLSIPHDDRIALRTYPFPNDQTGNQSKQFSDLENDADLSKVWDTLETVVISVSLLRYPFWKVPMDGEWNLKGNSLLFNTKLIKQEGQVLDAELHRRFQGLINRLGGGIENEIKSIWCVFNAALKNSFEACRNRVATEMSEKRKQVNWKKFEDFEQRAAYLDRFDSFSAVFDMIHEGIQPLVVPSLLSCADEDTAWNICENGFADKIQYEGPFGKGVYFTSSLLYAMQQNFAQQSGKVMVLACVIPGAVFPVTENVKGGCIQGYHSHYSIVDPTSHPLEPIAAESILDNYADQLVVFSEDQYLPDRKSVV